MDLQKLLRAHKAELERNLAWAEAERDRLANRQIERAVDLRDVERQIAALDADPK